MVHDVALGEELGNAVLVALHAQVQGDGLPAALHLQAESPSQAGGQHQVRVVGGAGVVVVVGLSAQG